MLNRVMIIGRLGADPELRYTQAGQPICSLRVATDESYTDKDGNRVERTEWHSVVTFGKTADHCNQYLHKGSPVLVQGRYLSRKYQTKDGRDAVSWYVQAQRVQSLDSAHHDGQQGQRQQGHQQGGGYDDSWKY